MIEKNVSFDFLKEIVEKKDLYWQYIEYNDRYEVFAVDNPIIYATALVKDPDNLETSEFLTNIKPIANRKLSISVLPDNAFQMQADAISAVCAHGTTTNIDYKIQNYPGENYTAKYLVGAEIFTKNASYGDWAECEIIDIDNVLGYGNGVVLKKYVRKFFINPNESQKIVGTAPGEIPVGLYVRVIYHSVGDVDPIIFINFDVEIKDAR